MSIETTETQPVETITDLLTKWATISESESIGEGETLSVNSGDTVRTADFENAGTVDNAGTVETYETSPWTNDAPNIYNYWDVPQSEKDPGADMPANVYIWSPISTETPAFSSDGMQIDAQSTVEIQLWTLDQKEAVELQEDILQILSKYFADNKVKSDWNNIWPQNRSDFREQKPAAKTSSYVMAVEVSLRGLKPGALANE